MSFSIKFDYRFDTEGFFDNPEKREVLEQAARIWSYYIQDEFTDINIGEQVNPRITTDVQRNSDGSFTTTTKTETITLEEPIDDLLIFVYSLNLEGVSTLATAQSSARFVIGSERDIRYNGSDFEPWIGSIYFNSAKNFFFDNSFSTDGLNSSQNDFLSVALHEIAHILGIGSAPAYKALVNNRRFLGRNAVALNNNQPIPLTEDLHIQEGFSTDTIDEVLLDPRITIGTRVLPTSLELAILEDIGYEIANEGTLPDFLLTPVTVNLAVDTNNISEGESLILRVTTESAVDGVQNLSLSLGGTVNGNDFANNIPTTITIPNGQTTTSVNLTLRDDDVIEGEETATFTLSNPSNGLQLGNSSQVIVTIADNDQIMENSVNLAIDTNNIQEGANQTITLTAIADNRVTGNQTLNLALSNSVSEADFSSNIPTSITIPNGQTTASVTLNLADDDLIEGTETATFTLSNPSNGLVLGNNSQVDLTIIDNDGETELNDPLFRFQNRNIPGTYLFTGEQESNIIRRDFPNFEEEGFAFNVSLGDGDNLIRFNRFQNSNVSGTYLFATEAESVSIRQNFPNFVEEGVAFYAYDTNSDRGIDYFRFQNTEQPGTYLFVGEEEKNNILRDFPQFALEGVAFEILV